MASLLHLRLGSILNQPHQEINLPNKFETIKQFNGQIIFGSRIKSLS
jgi:hypothetical protein